MVPLPSNDRKDATPVSSDVEPAGAPAGSAKYVRFFAMSTSASEVGVGKSNMRTFDATAAGLVPAGYGADCSAPTPVVSLTPVSQYQRVPSGETDQPLTPLATVARLASLPMVCIFTNSGPVVVPPDDQPLVSRQQVGTPTWKCPTLM